MSCAAHHSPNEASFEAYARTAGGRRLAAAFGRARQEGRAALVGYWMGGYPDVPTSEQALVALVRGGCDVLEVGVPFSDPVADGPVLQHAASKALERGATLRQVLEAAARVQAAAPSVPVVIMSYYNPLLQMGTDHFTAAVASAGLAGLIAPDLPLEEAEGLRCELEERGLAWVSLAAPTSGPRLARLARASDGFVYAVSRLGVTGARQDVAPQARELVEALRHTTPLPVAVGFGVAGPQQASAYRFADGVVVGSAFAALWERQGNDPPAALHGVEDLAFTIRRALEGP